ncbi:hypothetical protein [Bradyrhizobium sp. Arg816]|uniref:hypothetical protein n=1 Tax=Bradyrhizobium sp. Arg816 TaxID=2998491 RepID=UPI00249F2DF6|nr:hypothetical protein [Bradyrhizobium sp. Arg816]MDI3564162.1 hypothetical protein [Bradyrhizobium sp. Arg816]
MAFYRNSTKGHGPLDAVAVPFEALKGSGRLITVVIMIFGVTLFLNLAKALLAHRIEHSR